MKMELTAIAIPKRYSLPLIVGLNIVILVVSYILVFGGQFKEKATLAVDLARAQQEVGRLTGIRSNMEKTRKEYASLTRDLQEAMKQMPEEKEIPNLLRQISTTAQGSRTRIKYFAPKEIAAGGILRRAAFRDKVLRSSITASATFSTGSGTWRGSFTSRASPSKAKGTGPKSSARRLLPGQDLCLPERGKGQERRNKR